MFTTFVVAMATPTQSARIDDRLKMFTLGPKKIQVPCHMRKVLVYKYGTLLAQFRLTCLHVGVKHANV